MNELLINGAFLGQRITGQQRYAHEISRRLLARSGVVLARPSGKVRNNRVASWAWAQRPQLRPKRSQYLLSLTSRSPLMFPRHILTVHDLFVLKHPEWYSARYVATHAPILREQLARARAFVTVSEPTYVELLEYLGTRADVVLAPNGVDGIRTPGDSSAYAAECLKKRGLQSRRYLLTVGSIEPRKNLARLAEAYRRLSDGMRRDMPLVVAGGRSDVFRRIEIKWPPGTILAGPVTDLELRSLYRNARAAVLPSLAEGFGLPVVEAMSNELPVFLSDIPVFRWVYGSGGTYFDPNDIEALTVVLERAARNGELATPADLAAKAREAQERFPWERSADRLYDFAQGLET